MLKRRAPVHAARGENWYLAPPPNMKKKGPSVRQTSTGCCPATLLRVTTLVECPSNSASPRPANPIGRNPVCASGLRPKRYVARPSTWILNPAARPSFEAADPEYVLATKP